MAYEFLRDGNVDKARSKFLECIDITPLMAFYFIRLLKYLNVDYVVAPYEADAQLAYLYKNGFCDSVITIDSDLLAFGVKRGFYKMGLDGFGHDINMERLKEVTEANFSWMNDDDFLNFCILCGCDYLPNIKGIAFKKAMKLMSESKGDLKSFLQKAALKVEVPESYEKDFLQAKLTFFFQRVYCPRRKKVVHLHDPKSHPYGKQLKKFKNLDFLGKMVKPKLS